jgi:hypothetical protein
LRRADQRDGTRVARGALGGADGVVVTVRDVIDPRRRQGGGGGRGQGLGSAVWTTTAGSLRISGAA